jgi:tRNA-specific 2-thiouridylase
MGSHVGLAFYTIGQRSGVGIGGREDSKGDPWYVAAKVIERNELLVVQGRDHPLLWSSQLEAGSACWINGSPAALTTGAPVRLEARIRHRHALAPCAVTAMPGERLHVAFDQPQWAVTPGQYVVFYSDGECLGGAMIEHAVPGAVPEPEAEAIIA